MIETLWPDSIATRLAQKRSRPWHLFSHAKTCAAGHSTPPTVFAFPLRTSDEPCSVHSRLGGFEEGTLRSRFESSFQNARMRVGDDEFWLLRESRTISPAFHKFTDDC